MGRLVRRFNYAPFNMTKVSWFHANEINKLIKWVHKEVAEKLQGVALSSSASAAAAALLLALR